MTYTSELGTIEAILGHIILGEGSMPLSTFEGIGHIVPLRRFARVPTPVLPPDPKSTPGFIFFSPALQSNTGAQIDVSSVLLTARVADTYQPPSVQSGSCRRPFVLGPPPPVPSGRAWPPDFSASYKPTLNDNRFGLMANKSGFAIRGELYDTITFETTVVLV